MKTVKNSDRTIALEAIFSVVVYKHSLSDFDFGGSSFAASLSFGTLRFYHHLNQVILGFLKKDFDKEDLDVFCILLLGSYQIIYENTPNFAAINESVNLTQKPWAKGLINAVLRNVSTVNIPPSYSHPKWLEKKIKHQYPKHFEEIFQQNNTKAPMTIRVTKDVLEYQNQLTGVGISSRRLKGFDKALVLDTPVAVSKLPEFERGSCYVQDASAQLCGDILEPQADELILDSCAAPGGKTTHLASCNKDAKIIALDNNPKRIERIYENVARLGLTNVAVSKGDSCHDDWWEGELFDKILLDAPCSATGVIRRHPDIKILRKASDINKLVRVQKTMLDNLWKMLKPNGVLLYATCSILKQENSEQIQHFLQHNNDCTLETIDIQWGEQEIGIQKLPSADFDGFYYAKLRKITP